MTGYFKTPLKDFKYTPYLKDGHIVRKLVVLVNDVVWVDSIGRHHVIPRGFVLDLTSLPITGVVFDKLGRHQRAAVPHDWFYANKTERKLWADRQIDEAMVHDSVVWWRRGIVNAGLFIGGAFAWYSESTVLIVDPETMDVISQVKVA